MAFIRGYFDGDGSVSIGRNGTGYNRAFEIIATNVEVLEAIRAHLPQPDHRLYLRQRGGTWLLGSYSIVDMTKYYHYLYDEATYFLRRKRAKFEQAIQTPAERKLAT